MGDTTKKQHYIWRKYLLPWTDTKDLKNGTVYVLRKKPRGTQEKIENRELMKIGFENYFYDISSFTPKDISVYKQFIAHFQKKSSIKWDLNVDVINTAKDEKDFIEKKVMCSFEDIDNEHHFLDKLYNCDIDFYVDSPLSKSMKTLKTAIFESILLQEQTLTDKDLEQILENSLQNMNAPDLKYEFNLFLSSQYFRSPKRHEALSDSFDEFKKLSNELSDLNNKFYVNLVTLFFTEQMAKNITENQNTSILLYNNKSSIPFITGDTPIINISDKEEVTIFHYPISPTIAVQVIISKIPLKNAVMPIDEELKAVVKSLNQKLFDNCSNEVYAHNREILNKYISE